SLGYLFQLLAMTGWTSLPWLWSLRQPTLVLMGRDDPLVPPVNGRILARLIPNARLQMIDDGHLFMVTRPIETAMAIEAFLSDRGAATGGRGDDCSGCKAAPTVMADRRRERTHDQCNSQGGEHGNPVVPRFDPEVRDWPRSS